MCWRRNIFCCHFLGTFSLPHREREGLQEQPPKGCSYTPCAQGKPAGGAAHQLSGPWKDTQLNNTARKAHAKAATADANLPFDAIKCSITEAPGIVIVPVYRAGGRKDQAVTRETRDLENYHLLLKPAVHLEASDREHVIPALVRRSGSKTKIFTFLVCLFTSVTISAVVPKLYVL